MAAMRIDAHQHFWCYDPDAYPWIRTDVLKQDHLPVDLRPQLDAAGVDGTVVVQARSTWEETRWLLELADRFPWIVGVVGWANLTAPDLSARLASLGSERRLVGIRCAIDHDVAADDTPSSDFLAGIATLTAEVLTFDLLIRPPQLPLARNLVAAAPDQRFIVDHIAKPPIRDQVLEPWATGIRQLAAFPNVACKLSGMVTEANPRAWQPADFVPYLDIVLEAFGPERLMIGSDWPVCRQAAEYAETLDVVQTYVARLSSDEQAAILGMSAMRWYRIRGLTRQESFVG